MLFALSLSFLKDKFYTWKISGIGKFAAKKQDFATSS